MRSRPAGCAKSSLMWRICTSPSGRLRRRGPGPFVATTFRDMLPPERLSATGFGGSGGVPRGILRPARFVKAGSGTRANGWKNDHGLRRADARAQPPTTRPEGSAKSARVGVGERARRLVASMRRSDRDSAQLRRLCRTASVLSVAAVQPCDLAVQHAVWQRRHPALRHECSEHRLRGGDAA
jgi:hypothetical protein